MNMRRLLVVLAVVVLSWQPPSHTQVSNLQIHFMDVGRGDGAILIAPSGETVMFDNGVWNQCAKPTTYLTSLGITKVDYQPDR
jgi:beta-lactamase superfamily II metal-dependent hydrolase